MAKTITLGPDSNLGPEGMQVMVDDDYEDKPHHKPAAKKTAANKPDSE